MKKLFYIVMIVLLGGVNNTVSAGVEGETSSTKNINPPARIRIDFSTRTMPSGGTCDGNKGICLVIGIEKNDGDSPRGFNGTGEIYLNSENKLVLNIIRDDAPESEDQSTFYVYQDVVLNDELSELLGVSSCVIKKGNYKISYSTYEYGTVLLNTLLK